MITPQFDIVTQVLQLGLLGAIFLCLIFRKWIVPEWTLKAAEVQAAAERAELIARQANDHADMAARLEAAQTQVTALQQMVASEMMPALTMASEINRQYTEELQSTVHGEPTSTPTRTRRARCMSHVDEAIAARTRALLEAAERVSRQLEAQNERLAEAIDAFHRDVLEPLRKRGRPGAVQRP